MSEHPQTMSRFAQMALLLALVSILLAVAAIVTCASWLRAPYVLVALLVVLCATAGWRQARFRSQLAAGGAMLLLIVGFAGAMLFTGIRHAEAMGQQAPAADVLQRLSRGMHDYYALHGRFPPAALPDRSGKPLLSWARCATAVHW